MLEGTFSDLDYEHLEEVDSTNDYLKRQIKEGELDAPKLIVADHQTAGRGTRGRSWQDVERKSLLLSMAAPHQFPEWGGRYGLAFAGAVAQGLVDGYPELADEIETKWPNDILLGGEKVGGVLVETVNDWIIGGVGINIDEVPRLEEEAPVPPTSLSEVLGRGVSRIWAGRAVALRVREVIEAENLEVLKEFLDFFLAHETSAGQKMTVSLDGERREVQVKRIDPETGELVCLREGEEIRVASYQQLTSA